MPSKLVQKLYLRKLPSGFTMTITNVVPTIPGTKTGQWNSIATTTGKPASISKSRNRSENNLSGQYPIPVAPSTRGLIGVVKFSGHGASLSSGTGGQVDISIRIQGLSTSKACKSHNIDEKGHFNVSANDWDGSKRPDCTKISYSCGDWGPDMVIEVANSDAQPVDAYFSVEVGANGMCDLILHDDIYG